ncbi:hybrid sensor histidine kinase/response regulator [Vibrio sp. RC27]
MDSIKQIYHDSEPNLSPIGWGGFICFPLFYFIWAELFPQPYENLVFRLFLGFMMLAIVKRRSVPVRFQKYLPYYFIVMTTMCLPYFFFYMLVMNNWSNVWGMSCMSAILLHVLIVPRAKIVFCQVVVAVLAAYLAVFWEIGYAPFTVVDWPQACIFIFAYVLGEVFVHRNQSTYETQVSIAKSFGAGIAHEMRNPMSTIKTSVDVLKALTPVPDESDSTLNISKKDLVQIHAVLNDADNVLHSASDAIDLLLASIDSNRISSTSFKRCKASEVIRDAIFSFPYKESRDRNRVNIIVHDDFEYFGSQTLLKYSIYNLLKNAFYYNYSETFFIQIELMQYGAKNVIRVRDNGVGVENDILEHIFDDFYSSGKHDGFGLGLPFCRKVMESFGGTITCQSEVEQWTEFELNFPLYESSKVRDTKSNVLKTKHVLYIGERDEISGNLASWANSQGFNYSRMHLHRACHSKSTYFDLVIVDIEKAYFQLTDLLAFEDNLHFSKSKICYLHDKNSNSVHTLPNNLGALLVTSQRWKEEGNELLDELIFNNHQPERQKYQLSIKPYNRRVLIVDDNRSLRMITSILLEREGYIVEQAQNGREALELIRAHQYDVVLLDIEMPQLNGLELTSLVRSSHEDFNNIVIIGYTGDNSPATIEQLREAGMNDYLVKPADKQVLLTQLEKWCSK